MTTPRHATFAILVAAALVAAPGAALARTKLVALPARDSIHLNLDHPTQSLVTEERVLNLQQGNNHVDFSWQGVQIDPATIQIQALDHPDAVKVINVSFPPGENALVWNIYSPEAAQERMRIHYLLSGLQRTVSYRQHVAVDEKQARLESRYRLVNRSGEDFDRARITVGYGRPWTADLRSGEAREITMFDAAVPVQKMYIYHAPSQREQTPLYYLLRNTDEWGLGEFKLAGGKMRFFQTDPQGSVIFLGEDWLEKLPVKEKAELSLGVARDVVVKRNVLKDERTNIKRSQDGKRIVLSDRVVQVRYEIENFKEDPVTVKIVEPMRDNWKVTDLKGGLKNRHERKDNATLEIFVDLPAGGEKQTVDLHYIQRNQLQQAPRRR